MSHSIPLPSSPPLLLLFLLLVGLSAAARPPFACDPIEKTTNDFPFCRETLPVAERVRDFIGRLTLQEKIKLLGNRAAAVPRLGINGYQWWSEALHGVSDVGPGTKFGPFGGMFPGATSFPQVITTAASFNASLWEQIGRVVSDEARAMYNGGMAGLTFWSPNVNIFRDPRWGRGQETPGEDPMLASEYAVRYVRGLQENDGDRLKVAACCKHYTAYDLDDWNGVDRFHFNAQVSKQDMEDTFNVPFRECVLEGKVASVMCSFNQVNGIPTCADPKLLRDTIRGDWGLNGYIAADCDSVEVFYDNQNYTSTPEEAAALAIKAGLDMDCGTFLQNHTEKAIKRGILREGDVDGALVNTVTMQMRLGMFDGEPSARRYGRLGPEDVCTPAHKELALEAARQGIVLLKNRKGSLLPLSPHHHHRTVAVIGPNSDVTVPMVGNYAGSACEYTSPLQGIGSYVKAMHRKGCKDVACTSDELFGEAIEASREADATVLVMGLDQSIERESKDRTGLLLPGRQQELVSKVAKASKGPTVLVLMSGGPIDVSFAENDRHVAGIIWAGYPGQAGGSAIADVLFGTHNPGGNLPMTWYPEDYVSKLPMTKMAMRSNPSKSYPGRTYRFYNGTTVYPFGHGLSYSKFDHTIVAAPTIFAIPLAGFHHHGSNKTAISLGNKAVRVTHAKCNRLSIGLRVDVRNTGSRDGSNTLLVFSTPPPAAGHWAPHKQLVAFKKVHIRAGSQERVEVNIPVCKFLSVVDESGIRRISMGEHVLQIGNIRHSISLQPA